MHSPQRIFNVSPATTGYVGSMTGIREKCTVSPRTIEVLTKLIPPAKSVLVLCGGRTGGNHCILACGALLALARRRPKLVIA
jgi:hypothetical protein